MGAEPEKETATAPAGTYRTISEEELAGNKQLNSNMVKENGDNCPDGADEKMLNEDEKKVAVKADLGDVKFVEQQNGDTKVDILEIKQAFTGLTKEQLMKYANDPFWVRLRWIMFISFWLIWLGMLGGAIYIIIGAPKCAPPPPKTWWEQGPLLDLDVPDSKPGKTENNPVEFLKSLESKLPLLGSFKGVFIPESVNPAADAYSAVIPTPSNISAFKEFADKAKEQNIKLIVDITPNYVDKSNEWFVKSEQGEPEYQNYFIWLNGTIVDGGERAPPNNWLTSANKPAWTYSDVRKQFYLHQFDENTPDLNFQNPTVVKEFDKVLQFWMENGASGVRLSKAKHLLIDPKFSNESISGKVGTMLDTYEFYNHDKTTYQDGLAEILVHWKDIVNQHTDGQGLLMLKDDVESLDSLKFNNTVVVDLPHLTRSKSSPPSLQHTAEKLQNSIRSAFVNDWPSWQYETKDGEISSELRFVTMLLPGTPVLKLEQVATEENNTKLNDTEYKSLVALRALPSMLYGQFNSYLLSNNTVFAYTRLKSGNPSFMVVYNPTESAAQANMTIVSNVPSELTVNLLSQNYKEKDISVKGKIRSDNVTISANSAIILTYAPVND